MAEKSIKSVNLLPEFIRSEKNSKFLSSTIDQLIQPPNLERIDGYVGSKLVPNYNKTTDNYLTETSQLRRDYQLEPALVVRDNNRTISDVIGIDDLTNTIAFNNGNTKNFDKLYRSHFASYNPHIDLDKFVNYQEYYWLVNGPDTVTITGTQLNSTSTFTVVDNDTETSFVFTPDGVSEDPLLILYRGNTYNFNVNSAYKFYIKTQPSLGNDDLYNVNISNNGVSVGTLTMIIDDDTPDTLYYAADASSLAKGLIAVRNIAEDSIINVDDEIVGKVSYTSGTGVELTNGMKIKFGGTVTPEFYNNKEFFVEGVGKAIKLIDIASLETTANLSEIYDENFDASPFDVYPFDNFSALPIDPEYITINRGSRDLNPWTRYNRWFHKEVITRSAAANNLVPVYPNDKRAKRPIIEFRSDLKLYNFGTHGVSNVDLIDDYITDAFSLVEGNVGHISDQVKLEQGNRVIFVNDTDEQVRNKIYEVNFVYIGGKKRLELNEVYTATSGICCSVNKGVKYQSTNWWFDGTNWNQGQSHDVLNEPPLFDLFDNNGDSLNSSSFVGNKIFGYEVGTYLDPILNIYVNYTNQGIGGFNFEDYLNNQVITLDSGETLASSRCFVKYAHESGDVFKNSWHVAEEYSIPIIEFKTIDNATSKIILESFQPIINDYVIEVFVNSKKIANNSYSVSTINEQVVLDFTNEIASNSNVLIKIHTFNNLAQKGYWESPLSLTNNPLNEKFGTLTFTEISDHLKSMTESSPDFEGDFPGQSNLRDINEIEQYGKRLISNINPISFSLMFLGKKEHSVITALTKASDQYNQFKLAFARKAADMEDNLSPADAVDKILKELNADKDLLSSYYYSDMIGYGSDKKVREWAISNPANIEFPINNEFNLTQLSDKSVLVYLNDIQLLAGTDYNFVQNDASLEILCTLNVGDILKIVEYNSTVGSYVPSTPTKLGLYPKFTPSIYLDDTYIEPVYVIQCHDGSIIRSYEDYRDDIVLEFEKRVYNNIKVQYRQDLLDYNELFPGAFKTNNFSTDDINKIITKDYVRWAGFYGVDSETNSSFDDTNSFTWNLTGSYIGSLDVHLDGSWRAVYKYLYGTDRPHTNPWEMLGFSEKPNWWDVEYGVAPYTSGNLPLWEDLADGRIRQGDRSGVDLVYKRTGLLDIIPVDGQGDLIAPDQILENIKLGQRNKNWKVGDLGPAEAAWRRSSYWPFVVQKVMALCSPVHYCSYMYDPYRITTNLAGQIIYSDTLDFLALKNIFIHTENDTLLSGYGVYVTEVGLSRTTNYVEELRSDLNYLDFNLFYKVGGFISKDKVQVVIDAIDPTSTSPGSVLPPEDYSLILNVSNPVSSTSISGIIVQKQNGYFVLKGYDTSNPYFTIFRPRRNLNTPTINVGGVSEPYVDWKSSSNMPTSSSNISDVTTAAISTGGVIYEVGQIVKYDNNFYRVKTRHRTGPKFEDVYYQRMPSLPIKGGTTVQKWNGFNKFEEIIPYGSAFDKVQDVYDVIIGYGQWLTSRGFIFDDYNTELLRVIDWTFSGEEFLYWVSQNWASNNVITISPFADNLKFKLSNTVVDNIFNSFYDYSLLQANGIPIPKNNINVNREEGLCTISTVNFTDGLYFATLNSVQKEHAIVLNNKTIFNDTIYDTSTGYRQLRIRLTGFRTRDWDGDYFSPGFIYDTALIEDWQTYQNFKAGDVVRFNGKYYTAKQNIIGSDTFNFAEWVLLGEKPIAQLLPNFDYKINQFEDFYSLDIDNFDAAQQKMAQHLIGYTPRPYLNNIFTNPIAQYKFYQGFIREKGTRNAIEKLAKAAIHNLQGEISYNEEWAFRIGHFGSFETFKELEVKLKEGEFVDNPQIVTFNEDVEIDNKSLIYYTTQTDLLISYDGYTSSNTFVVTTSTEIIQLETAGFVRFDDVDYTAYNTNSIIDIENNRSLLIDDYVWIANKLNKDWDVFRYVLGSSKLSSVSLQEGSTDRYIFTTKKAHTISKYDIVSISQFSETVNGVYQVIEVPTINSFVISTTSTFFFTGLTSEEVGLVFKFQSAKFSDFDNLPKDSFLLRLPYGAKNWLLDDGLDRWQVIEKIKNYNSYGIEVDALSTATQLGYKITKTDSLGHFAVSAAGTGSNTGTIFVYKELDEDVELITKYGINNLVTTYYKPGGFTNFGQGLAYHTNNFNTSSFGIIFAGAPLVNFTRESYSSGGLRFAGNTGSYSTRLEEGLVKISTFEGTNTEISQGSLISPSPTDYERYGSSIYVSNSATGSTEVLLVGAPSISTTGTGSVYVYNFTTASNLVNVSYVKKIQSPFLVNTGTRFGQSISGSKKSDVIVIAAPGYYTNTGFVSVYTTTGITYLQTLTSPFERNAKFGESVAVSNDGQYIFVGAPDSRNKDQSYGKVAVYKNTSTSSFYFDLESVIENPVEGPGMKFGRALGINTDSTELVVTAQGTNKNLRLTFDRYESLLLNSLSIYGSKYVKDSNADLSDQTTFDSGSTTFFDIVKYSGSAYVYNRYLDKFKLADELTLLDPSTGTNYGFSVALNDNSIYVGAPAYKTSIGEQVPDSAFYQYIKKDQTAKSWDILRAQDDLIDINTVQKLTLYNTFNDEVLEHLDIIDPLKGKISGIAEEDIKYKSQIDPAVYSIGNELTVIDAETNWLDDHVGEIWWDTSNAKYVWYEQGELSYRKTNWGRLFPGSTIDIYEWVGSELLPSEWAVLADTPQGLTDGISGQPKHPLNDVLSVKQVYNTITGGFTNVYYFWVKNRILLPNTKNRRTTAVQIANIIENPSSYGLKFGQIMDQNALSLANIGSMLIDDRISLNISTDVINNKIPRHTEWLLMQEGSAKSMPTALLEKKLLDSLLGRDVLGNPVPDPTLTSRERYGIGIRPRQTLFADRLTALRNVVEYVNEVVVTERISENYSLNNLKAKEEIPHVSDGEYDILLEDNEGLSFVNVSTVVQAQIECTVTNGKIISVNITEPGNGYLNPPIISIDNNLGASLKSVIDSNGKVIDIVIENAGNGFAESPNLSVRPFTAIVQVDNTQDGKWSKYEYRGYTDGWVRVKTQSYNTTLYWDYIDWVDSSYNKFVDYAYTLDEIYQLKTIEDITNGQYVKVKNNGLGNYIILEKIEDTILGSFAKGYNIVYSEKGTIQIKDSLWNYGTYEPYQETFYILKAIKEDLFVNELKVHYNLLFFRAVKYALTEQKRLDWAFKTSFINVVNNAGSLDQRSSYKLQNSEYYESYLKEVKPYHTQIRNFTTRYNQVEPSGTYITDFDFPPYYDDAVNRFNTLTIPANTPASSYTSTNSWMLTYPWKAWVDNYTYYVGEIRVANPGAGYTETPIVTLVTQAGNLGSGATARAFIRSGSVVGFEITNVGSGYTRPPQVVITGGGSVTEAASGYAVLSNDCVREITVGMKFDRTSRRPEVSNINTVDKFLCNGADTEFILSWIAVPDKSQIQITLDGQLVLSSDYTVSYYSSYIGANTDYQKIYSKIVFINYVPKTNQVLTVNYKKNVALLNAVDRIVEYYSPTDGMPGTELSQLMDGIEFPKTVVEGLPFNYTTKWGINWLTDTRTSSESTSAYGISYWADDISFYANINIVNTASSGTTILTLSTTTGILPGQLVNIVSESKEQLDKSFFNVPPRVKEVNTSARTVTLTTSTRLDLTATISTIFVEGTYTNTTSIASIEFWSYDTQTTILDSAIEGGGWTTGTRVSALGINPDDITIDGESFISPNHTYAPEELLPGEINQSVGINVYTKHPEGAPVVVNSYYVIYGDNNTSTRTLSITPPNSTSLVVTFENRLMSYNSTTNFTTSTEFSMNWSTNEIIVAPQSINGILGVSIISVGGGRDFKEAGVIDTVSITASTSTVQLVSLAQLGTVKSAYVTVNGESIEEITNVNDYGYILTYANENSNRAAVNVYNIPYTTSTITAWFFGTAQRYFNEIKEQIFDVSSVSETNFTLAYPPGVIEPVVAQTIVEVNQNGNRTYLRPPDVTYFKVTNSLITSYTITTTGVNYNSVSQVRVYLNGRELRRGFDYTNNGTNTYNISVPLVKDDVIAILALDQTSSYIYEYDIVGNLLTIQHPTYYTYPYELKVITYNNHDDMLMRTERFLGNPSRRYVISRPVLDSNYVWVIVDGVPLVNHYDYEILDDSVTVQISDEFYHNETNEVTIITFSSEKLASTILGYRIFHDIFQRTHFKRLSKENTTYLTRPLSVYDTEIYVANAEVLTSPDIEKNLPGVVLIDGERIEFFKAGGNVLSQLRRATLGTSPSFYSHENTKVIDQGSQQTVPFSERILKQTHYTLANSTTYYISTETFTTSTQSLDYLGSTTYYSTVTNDGIELNEISTTTSIPNAIKLEDQVTVVYGGRILNKNGTFKQDIELTYDTPYYLPIPPSPYYGEPISPTVPDPASYASTVTNYYLRYLNRYPDQVGLDYWVGHYNNAIETDSEIENNIKNSQEAKNNRWLAEVSYLPTTNVLGTAYVITSTNQVWIYTNSDKYDAVNGYEYSGINYIPPEFTIKDQYINLNLQDGVQQNIKLVIVKREFDAASVWNDVVNSTSTYSLMTSTTVPARFLQARPAELPDKYYYGGDVALANEGGFALTDENNEPLEEL